MMVTHDVTGDLKHPCRQPVHGFDAIDIAMHPNERVLKQIIGNVVGGNPAANKPPQVCAQMRPDHIGRRLIQHQKAPSFSYAEQAHAADLFAVAAESGSGEQHAALSSQQPGVSAQHSDCDE